VKIQLVQHCAAILATAELLFNTLFNITLFNIGNSACSIESVSYSAEVCRL